MTAVHRLTLEDLRNPMFDLQKFARRKVAGKIAFEGTTYTDNFRLVGVTYFEKSGLMLINDTQNRPLFTGTVTTAAQFSAAMKKADKCADNLERP